MIDLREMIHPGNPCSTVRVFSSEKAVIDHLIDHVLTEPETFSWEIVNQGIREIFDPTSHRERFRLVKDLRSGDNDKLQDLYDLYCHSIQLDNEDARQLNWHRSLQIHDQEVTVSLGTSGILTVIEENVVTAFLPGQGVPEQVLRSRLSEKQASPLPRQHHGMRSRSRKSENRMDTRNRENREKNWSSDQKLYYRVFKTAVGFVRSCVLNASYRMEPHRGHYGVLKECKSIFRVKKYEEWLLLRANRRSADPTGLEKTGEVSHEYP